MTRRRFYAPPSSFAGDRQSVRLAADEARHLRDVLRLQRGDQIYVFDGAGKEFHCTIEDSGRDFAQLGILAEVQPARLESPLDLTLAVALLKGEKFDLVVQKATELGAKRVLPIITERADVRLRDDRDANKRVARWQRIALEAAKQSGRAVVPEVTPPRAFQSLLEELSADGQPALPASLKVMFSERDGKNLTEAISRQEIVGRPMVALVGSEGGWTDEEIASAHQAGWEIVTLGGRTLRAETAAIVVVALLQNLLGDLK
ncbi:MAG: methyltransferase, RsmE family [Acidobacteria bacterium]|nr:methyltransferase, RsmE family [Acidobacteriota bacterium]